MKVTVCVPEQDVEVEVSAEDFIRGLWNEAQEAKENADPIPLARIINTIWQIVEAIPDKQIKTLSPEARTVIVDAFRKEIARWAAALEAS